MRFYSRKLNAFCRADSFFFGFNGLFFTLFFSLCFRGEFFLFFFSAFCRGGFLLFGFGFFRRRRSLFIGFGGSFRCGRFSAFFALFAGLCAFARDFRVFNLFYGVVFLFFHNVSSLYYFANTWLPIVTVVVLEKIQADVAVAGL